MLSFLTSGCTTFRNGRVWNVFFGRLVTKISVGDTELFMGLFMDTWLFGVWVIHVCWCVMTLLSRFSTFEWWPLVGLGETTWTHLYSWLQVIIFSTWDQCKVRVCLTCFILLPKNFILSNRMYHGALRIFLHLSIPHPLFLRWVEGNTGFDPINLWDEPTDLSLGFNEFKFILQHRFHRIFSVFLADPWLLFYVYGHLVTPPKTFSCPHFPYSRVLCRLSLGQGLVEVGVSPRRTPLF